MRGVCASYMTLVIHGEKNFFLYPFLAVILWVLIVYLSFYFYMVFLSFFFRYIHVHGFRNVCWVGFDTTAGWILSLYDFNFRFFSRRDCGVMGHTFGLMKLASSFCTQETEIKETHLVNNKLSTLPPSLDFNQASSAATRRSSDNWRISTPRSTSAIRTSSISSFLID